MLTPSDIPQLLESGRTILLPGRILVSPHGTLIWNKKKKAIVSSKKIAKYVGLPIYFIEGDKALGIIQLKAPREINLEEFKELRKFHHISDKEVHKWWPNKKIFYFYLLELISKFDPPKKIIRPKGAQVWLQTVTFKSDDFINPVNLTDEELIEAHKKIHELWQKGEASKEDCLNYHILIKEELLKRKLEHKGVDDLDKKSKEFQERFSKIGFKISFFGTKGLVEEEGLGHRFHSSVLYEYEGKKLLVDCGEKNQNNLAKIKPDFLLCSHSHPDHLLGFKDMAIVVSKEIEEEIPNLYKDFNIDTRAKYESYKIFKLGPFKITAIPVFHSVKSRTHAFLIQMGDRKVLQATDILGWHAGDKEKYIKNLDLAVIDGSSLTRTLARRKREKSEPYGHSSITNQVKNWYTPDKVKRLIVTHLGKEPLSLGDEELLAKIRENTGIPITIAKDNNIINLAEKYAPIYTSGKVEGKMITLKEVLPYFRFFFIQKPLVYLTGGLVNQGQTKGDIDILLPEWIGLDMRRIIEFRIARSFPIYLRKRLHFVYDKFSSPFTNSVPIYDLLLMKSKKKIIRLSETEKQLREKPRVAGAIKDAESSAREDKIKLFRYFLPLKPTRGYYPEKKQTIDLFIEVMEKMGSYPFFMERKFDGVNIEVHRDKDKIEIFSEDGNRVTNQFPKIIEAIKKIKGNKMVLMGELECWKDGKHLPREYSNGIMASKEIDDEDTILNIYDCPYYNEDIHNQPFIERRKILEGLNFPQNTWETPSVEKRLNLAGGFWVKNRQELRLGVEKLRKLVGSEGTVTKTKDFKYNLKGIRSGSVKFHNSTEVYGKVLEIKETKVKGVYNYYFGLEPGKFKMKTEKLGNVFYHRSGRTFSTSLKANVGDILEIEGETLNAEHDLKTNEWKLSLWAPRVMRKAESRYGYRKADTVQEAISRAKKNYCLQEKEITNEGETIYLAEIEKQQDPFLEYPKIEKKWKYTIQRHFRGAGHHLDLRIKHNDFLLGWTIADSLKGKPGKPITTLVGAKRLKQNEISKIDWNKGVPKLRPGIKLGFKKKYAELATMRKSPEPKEWLEVQGVTPKGEIGSTKEYPGVFYIIDNGFCEYGSQKSYFHEYFFSDGKLKGRWFFRQLRPAEFRGKVEKQEVIAPARETKFKEEAPWFMIKPIDETPYAISKAAIDKNWIPPFEVSALPEHVKKQVPEKFQYWKSKDEKKRLEIRNELVKSQTIKLSEIIMKPYIAEHSCRLRSPKGYERFFRQNCKIKHNGKCIDLVFGVKGGKSEIQAMRYPKNVWTADEAKNHCKSKKGTFEAAKIEKILNLGAIWARAAYHYVLSQQQWNLWIKTSEPEKVKRVNDALDSFKKLKEFKVEWIDDSVKWLMLRPNEIKTIMIEILRVKKSREIDFVLQHHFFRGPKIIRAGVSSEHWDLRFNFPDRKGLMHFVLNLDPLKNKEVTALWKPCKFKEWMTISQYLPPKNERAKMSKEELAKLPPGIEEANPTLATSSYIKIVDKGKTIVYEDGELFKKFGFKGTELKGLWTFERENESKFWVFKQSGLPKAT